MQDIDTCTQPLNASNRGPTRTEAASPVFPAQANGSEWRGVRHDRTTDAGIRSLMAPCRESRKKRNWCCPNKMPGNGSCQGFQQRPGVGRAARSKGGLFHQILSLPAHWSSMPEAEPGDVRVFPRLPLDSTDGQCRSHGPGKGGCRLHVKYKGCAPA